MGWRLSVGRHLYWRIWLAIVGTIVVLTTVLGLLWQWQVERERAERPGRLIVVRNAQGEVLGQAHVRVARVPGQGPEFQVPLRDGQTLHIQLPRPPRPPSSDWRVSGLQSVSGLLVALGLVAAAVALGAYPIVRRLTQGLEVLQKGVERWGEGDLSARLPVQGEDEIAFLAERFNAAAARVQSLWVAHQSLLANASHELRSPLARIRMGLELLDAGADAALQRREMARNIAELDALVDEILLASRLEHARHAGEAVNSHTEEVDLLGLVVEEAARVDAVLASWPEGPPPVVWGDARLLRRMVRNLIENALRHGRRGGEGVRIALAPVSGTTPAPCIEIVVDDQGQGVPPEWRERIFEPFFRVPGASERDGGVGLGLALVRQIARQHRGEVRCEAAPGGGARFVVQLPL